MDAVIDEALHFILREGREMLKVKRAAEKIAEADYAAYEAEQTMKLTELAVNLIPEPLQPFARVETYQGRTMGYVLIVELPDHAPVKHTLYITYTRDAQGKSFVDQVSLATGCEWDLMAWGAFDGEIQLYTLNQSVGDLSYALALAEEQYTTKETAENTLSAQLLGEIDRLRREEHEKEQGTKALYCPLLKTACEQANCAWWDAPSSRCCVVQIIPF